MNVKSIFANFNNTSKQAPKWLPKNYEYIEKSSSLEEELNEIFNNGMKFNNTQKSANAENYINSFI